MWILNHFALREHDTREISVRIRGVKIARCSVPMRTMWAGSAFQYHGQRPIRLFSIRNVQFMRLIKTIVPLWTTVQRRVVLYDQYSRDWHTQSLHWNRWNSLSRCVSFAQEQFIPLGLVWLMISVVLDYMVIPADAPLRRLIESGKKICHIQINAENARPVIRLRDV